MTMRHKAECATVHETLMWEFADTTNLAHPEAIINYHVHCDL